MEYQHLLLTWFNLHFSGWGDFKGLNEAWLDKRFKLFMKFCYPSIKAQTNQNFTWFVYFHPKTPPRHMAMIQDLYDEYDNFCPMFVDCAPGNALVGMGAVRAHARTMISKPYLITSRVCNDDSLHSSFIANIQKKFARQRMQFINFPHGYYVNTKNGQLRDARYPNNMFISLIEDTRQSRRTVLDFNHGHVHRKHKILDVETKHPAWLVSIHGGNKSCGMRGNKIDSAGLKKHFPCVS